MEDFLQNLYFLVNKQNLNRRIKHAFWKNVIYVSYKYVSV